jgi:hypothetical protein
MHARKAFASYALPNTLNTDTESVGNMVCKGYSTQLEVDRFVEQVLRERFYGGGNMYVCLRLRRGN